MIRNNFMYGGTFIAGEEADEYRKKPANHRVVPPLEDEIINTRYLDNYNKAYTKPEYVAGSSILNIETELIRTVKLHIYAVKEEDDTNIILEIGKVYKISYVDVNGLCEITGKLEFIDTRIPCKKVRYVGNYDMNANDWYIGLDCSGSYESNNARIFISSIRSIEEVIETTTDNTTNDNTTD